MSKVGKTEDKAILKTKEVIFNLLSMIIPLKYPLKYMVVISKETSIHDVLLYYDIAIYSLPKLSSVWMTFSHHKYLCPFVSCVQTKKIDFIETVFVLQRKTVLECKRNF